MYETFPNTLQRPQQRFDYFQALIERLFCPMHMTRCVKSEFGTTLLEARARAAAARPLSQRLKVRKE
jgi:hypothetical protein